MNKITIYLILLIFPFCAIAQNKVPKAYKHIGQFNHTLFPFYKDQIKPFILPNSLSGKELRGVFTFDVSVDSFGTILSVATTHVLLYQDSLSGFHKEKKIWKIVLDANYNRVKGCWDKEYPEARTYINWANQEFMRTVRIKQKKAAPPPGYKYFSVRKVNYITLSIDTYKEHDFRR